MLFIVSLIILVYVYIVVWEKRNIYVWIKIVGFIMDDILIEES